MIELLLLTTSLIFGGLAYYRFQIALAVFFALLPTYLIRFHIGPLPTTYLELLFWILSVVWLMRHYKHSSLQSLVSTIKHHVTTHPSLFFALTLFLTGATVGIFFATDIRAALGEWKAFYIEPVLLFIILITSVKTRRHVTLILSGLFLSGFVTALLAIYQHFTGWLVPHAFWANRNTYRVTSWYGFPNAVGLFLAPLVPISLYVLKEFLGKIQDIKYKKQDTRYKIQTTINKQYQNSNVFWKLKFINWKLFVSCLLCLGILITFILATVYAKSTGSLIGVAAGTGILLLFYKKTRWPAIALGLVGLVGVFLLPADNPIKTELLAQDRSGQIRVHIWAETVELLSHHPIVGAGLASYSEKIAPYHTLVNGERIEIFHHPHNILLTMWVNIGIVGLIGFLLLFIWFYKQGIQLVKLEIGNWKLGIFLVSSMTVILVSGLVDSPYIKNDLAMLFWLIIGLMVVATNTQFTTKKATKQSVGCFFTHNQTFLIMHRTPHSYGGATWGLVGGKIEPNEQPTDAVQREIFEETRLHISKDSIEFIGKTVLEYPDVDWDFSLFRLPCETKPEITLDPKEHQAYQWITLDEAKNRSDLLPGLYVVLEKFGKEIF